MVVADRACIDGEINARRIALLFSSVVIGASMWALEDNWEINNFNEIILNFYWCWGFRSIYEE